MNGLKILLAGNSVNLEQRLRQHENYEIAVESDYSRAAERLHREWFHIGIVHLRQQDGRIDPAALSLALSVGNMPPKIIVFSEPLDQTGQMVRDVLVRLQDQAPADAFISEAEDPNALLVAVDQIARHHIRINTELKIQPDYILYDLVNWIQPDADRDGSASELQDLFRILFYNCTSIQVERSLLLPQVRNRMITLWVQPHSEGIPNEYPVLITCGTREVIEQIKSRYEAYLFRLTPWQLAGHAQTKHFAAVARPAPNDRLNHRTFSEYYKDSRGEDPQIGDVIDHLFERTGQPWYEQFSSPQSLEMQTLRSHYLVRFGMKDELNTRAALKTIMDSTPGYGAIWGLVRDEIGIKFSTLGTPHYYPHPILCLYKHIPLQILDMKPAHFRIGHGDFRGTNFCVEHGKYTIWLEGYENLEWGPAVADVAALETLIKFQCMDCRNLRTRYEFERWVLSPGSFDEFPDLSQLPQETRSTANWVAHLRKKWADQYCYGGISEYYANLFFFAMREFVTETSDPFRASHALLSAAMICYRLREWGAWSGWPGTL